MNKDQTNINTLIRTADTFLETKRYEDAMKVYSEVVEIEKQHSKSWLMLGECFVILGRDKEAIKAFNSCLLIDDPYAIPAYYQVAMVYSRLGDNDLANDYHNKALLVDKRTKPTILFRSSLSHHLEIIGTAIEVHFFVGAWHWDYGRNKIGWWQFKWREEDLFFSADNKPWLIGKAKTEDMAQKVAGFWLDGWLKYCGIESSENSGEIEEVESEIQFVFLLRDKRGFREGEFIFLWKDGKVIPHKGSAIGHSKIQLDAFRIAHEWLNARISGN